MKCAVRSGKKRTDKQHSEAFVILWPNFQWQIGKSPDPTVPSMLNKVLMFIEFSLLLLKSTSFFNGISGSSKVIVMYFRHSSLKLQKSTNFKMEVSKVKKMVHMTIHSHLLRTLFKGSKFVGFKFQKTQKKP